MKIKQSLMVSTINLTTRQSDKSMSQAKELKFKTSCAEERSTAGFEITNSFLCWETQSSLNYMFYEAEQS